MRGSFTKSVFRLPRSRRGVVVVLTGALLVVLFAFLALSIDTGRIVLEETRMQNAVDAASLAAAQEIMAAVHAAGQGEGSANIDSNSIAVEQARDMAQQVAAANNVYINPETDVKFGKRTYDAASGTWPVQWGVAPYNVVQVIARRTGDDVSAADGQFPVAFGWAVGREKVPLETSAAAFVEARDLVMVVDYSGSMNYDSQLSSPLGLTAAEQLLDNMWNTMVDADPTWPDTEESKFPSSGLGAINSPEGTYVSSSTTSDILNSLGLTANGPDGKRLYPYPQSGRYSDGTPKNKPSNSTSDALWGKYVDFVKNHPVSSYRKKYGYRTLMDFLQQKTINGFTPRDRYTSEDMWRTPHQPMNAVKNGASLFLDFLDELDFGDEVGLVGYGKWAEQVMGLSDGSISVDVSSNPITDEYGLINSIQRHHQAGEFDGQTALGDGILKAKEMLVGTGGDDTGYARYGARPTMLVMTDGQTNQAPSGWSMPYGFDWAEFTDYDGDGTEDYSASDTKKKYAFYQAVQAASRGITIHTLAVGASADRDLLRAIAFVGGGVFIDVPGGGNVADMEADLLEAFGEIASKVPPAKLVYELDAP